MDSPRAATIEKGVETLNSLLRGEISAVEMYQMAIEKVRDDRASEATQLRAIAQEHGEGAQSLREQVRRLGGDPDESSGAWGALAKVMQASMDLFGDKSALKSLKEGEERGLKDYRDAVAELDAESRTLVSEYLIPAQQRHIATLDGMITRD